MRRSAAGYFTGSASLTLPQSAPSHFPARVLLTVMVLPLDVMTTLNFAAHLSAALHLEVNVGDRLAVRFVALVV